MKSHTPSYVVSLGFLLALGCSGSDLKRPPEGEPWKLEESKAATTTPPVVEPEATPEPERPKPAIADDKTVVFEPGQLPWAKPDHRVIFHLIAESKMNEGDGTMPMVYPTQAFPANDLKDNLAHQLFFAPTLSYESKLEYDLGSVSTPNHRQEVAEWAPFRGVYLPRGLATSTEPPTLHMFESSDIWPEKTAYRFDGFVVEWNAGYRFMISVPSDHPKYAWIECQHTKRHKVPLEPDSEDCGDVTEDKTLYEAVFWFGEDPSNDPHEHSYVVPTHVRTSHRNRPYLGGEQDPAEMDREPVGLQLMVDAIHGVAVSKPKKR